MKARIRLRSVALCTAAAASALFALQSIGGVPPGVCIGDANDDFVVDSEDLNIVLANFGCTGPFCTGDLNSNNMVATDDLNIVLGQFGKKCNKPGG